ncbi:hypothetical protein GCM10020220_107850 [Nonomuraea rubra]
MARLVEEEDLADRLRQVDVLARAGLGGGGRAGHAGLAVRHALAARADDLRYVLGVQVVLRGLPEGGSVGVEPESGGTVRVGRLGEEVFRLPGRGGSGGRGEYGGAQAGGGEGDEQALHGRLHSCQKGCKDPIDPSVTLVRGMLRFLIERPKGPAESRALWVKHVNDD